MTDAMREKIDEYFRNEDRLSELCDLSPFDAAVYGATHQHPIAEKAGYNQGLDAAIEIVRSVDPAFIVQELEALKTEIKK